MSNEVFQLADTSTRQRLQPLSNQPGYEWLEPIVSRTLREYVDEWFSLHPPEPSRLNRSRVEEHLNECSALLSNCLELRSQIFELEGQALLAADQYVAADAASKSDAELMRLNVHAMRATAGLPDAPPSQETIDQREKAARDQLARRLALHNIDGGPLNYGQRVEQLRAVFGDSLRALAERMTAARAGLAQCFGVDTPAFSVEQLWNLDEALWWTRRAIRAYETGSQREVLNTIYVRLQGTGLLGERISMAWDNDDRTAGIAEGERVSTEPLWKRVAEAGECKIPFILTMEDAHRLGLEEWNSHRVVGISVRLCTAHPFAPEWFVNDALKPEELSKQEIGNQRLSNELATYTYPANVIPPGSAGPTTTPDPNYLAEPNSGQLAGSGLAYYPLPPVGWWYGGALESVFTDASFARVENEPLFGKWVLQIADFAIYPGSGLAIKSPLVNRSSILNPQRCHDIAVAFRIASRPIVSA